MTTIPLIQMVFPPWPCEPTNGQLRMDCLFCEPGGNSYGKLIPSIPVENHTAALGWWNDTSRNPSTAVTGYLNLAAPYLGRNQVILD